MKKKFLEAFGWYGAAAVVLAYGLTSFQLLEPTSWYFFFLNGTGSLGILTVSLHKKTYQPAALNFLWLLIACAAGLQMF